MANQIFRLGANGLEELKAAPVLPVGTKIIAFGYAGIIQNYAVTDSATRQVVEIDSGYCLDSYFSPVRKLDKYTLPIEKKFGIGFYYDLSAPKYTPEDIAQGFKRAERIEQLKKEREQKRATAEAKAKADAREKYSYLKEGARGCEVAANLRKELKKTFPGIKFSVRYSSFSGGDDITVKYTDGPHLDIIKAIARKYQDHDSDCTGDYWDYTPSAFNKVFGGVSFVSVERNFSPETLAAAAKLVAKICPDLTKAIHRDIFFDKYNLSGEDGELIILAVGSAYWIDAQSLARAVAGLNNYNL